jgi:hypothetical protein
MRGNQDYNANVSRGRGRCSVYRVIDSAYGLNSSSKADVDGARGYTGCPASEDINAGVGIDGIWVGVAWVTASDGGGGGSGGVGSGFIEGDGGEGDESCWPCCCSSRISASCLSSP